MTKSEKLKRMVAWADKRADESARDDKPWALGNLRYYQNMGIKFYRQYAAACREEGIQP